MILLGILLSVATIGCFCWLLFTLAVYALPLFAGLVAGSWAFHNGAGWTGAIAVALVASSLILGLGQVLLATMHPLWARLPIILAFATPAAFAGYHAVHGIVQHMVPSEPWQVIFSLIGAAAVGIVAFVRIAGIAPTEPSERRSGAARSCR